jgi:hypothetical protein
VTIQSIGWSWGWGWVESVRASSKATPTQGAPGRGPPGCGRSSRRRSPAGSPPRRRR